MKSKVRKSKAVSPDRRIKGKTTTAVGSRFAEPKSERSRKASSLTSAQKEISERKQAGEALPESEKRFRALIEHSDDAIALLSADGTVLYDSPSILRVLGYGPTERIGRKVFDFVYSKDRENMMHGFAKFAQQTGAVAPSEVRFVHKDGSPRWIEGMRTNLLHEPTVKAVVVNYRDITERKKADEALRLAEEKYRTLFQNSIDGIFQSTLEGRFLIVNPAFARMLGYASPQEMIATVTDIGRQVYVESARREEFVRSLAEQGSVTGFEFEMRRKDGSTLWVSENVRTVRDAEGKLLYYEGTVEDITARRQGEEELRRSRELLRQSFASLHDALFIIDDSTVEIRDCNPAASEMFGYARSELLGQTTEFLHVDKAALTEFRNRLDRAVQDIGFLYLPEYHMRKKDGTIFTTEHTVTPLQDGQGRTTSWVSVVRDITKRKQTEAALHASEARFRGLFEDSPISLWEEDFSAVKQRLDGLREEGITDFQEYFTSHPEVITECTALIKVLDVNKATMHLFGAKRKEEMLKSLARIFEGEPSEAFRDELINIAEGKARFEWEGVNTTLDGRRINIELRWSIFPGYQNSLSRVIVSMIDSTERKRREEQLAESESRYKSLFEDSPVSLWEEDFSLVKQRLDALRADGITDFQEYFTSHPEVVAECETLIKVLDVNKATVSLFGAKRKEDFPSDLAEILESQPIQVFQDELVNIAAGKTRFGWEGINKTLDGQLRNIDVSWSVAPGFENSLSKVIISVIDTTERKQAEILQDAVYRIASATVTTGSLDDLYAEIHHIISGVMHAENFYITIYDEERDLLKFPYFKDASDEAYVNEVHPEKGLTAYVLRTGKSLLCTQAVHDELERRGEVELLGAPSSIWLGVPLSIQGKTIGAMVLQHYSDPAAYTEREQHMLEFVSAQVATAIRRKQAEAKAEDQLQRLAALRAIEVAISSSFDLRVTLDLLLGHVTSALGVDAAAVLLLSRSSNELVYAAGHGFRGTGITRMRVKLGDDYVGKAVLERRTFHIPNIAEAEGRLAKSELLADEKFVSFYAVPFVAKGHVKGVMELFNRGPLDPDPEWLDFLETLAGQAAIAIDNAQLFEELQRSNMELALAYDSTIEGWSQAMDLRGTETEGHTQRVTEEAVKLARAMQLPESDVTHLRRGALLHDIGKIGVPDAILRKPEALTDDEWVVMKRHPTLAYEMLSHVRYLQPVINIPYCHHEKWDGTGYPRGLKGDQIPLAARIFAVIDVYDALTSDRPFRPYRTAWSREKALEYIRSESGKHFDPDVADAFLSMKAEEQVP